MKLTKTADLRKGRTAQLNIKKLECKEGRNFAEVIFFGDLHLGHPTCLMDKAQPMLDYALENRAYVLLMGDLIECGLTGSIGDSVYAQNLDPQGQIEAVVELLQPLAKEGLILGLHEGNHEARIYKTSGVNVAKMMAGILRVPFLHSACWQLWRVGKQNYKVYSLHGSSGSRFVYTKIKSATDISHYFPRASIIAMGHVHDISVTSLERQDVSLKNKQVIYYKQYVVLTGHYLGYSLSYAQMKGLPPSRIGSPKLKLFANDHDVHSRT